MAVGAKLYIKNTNPQQGMFREVSIRNVVHPVNLVNTECGHHLYDAGNGHTPQCESCITVAPELCPQINGKACAKIKIRPLMHTPLYMIIEPYTCTCIIY